MKHYIMLIVLLVNLRHFVSAQDSSVLKRISFRIAITHTDLVKTKGWLGNINDSSLLLSDKALHFAGPKTNSIPLKEIDYAGVLKITVKRNNGGGRGAISGAVSGFVIGAAAGLIDGDDPKVPPSQDYFGIGNAFRMSAG